MLSPSRCRQAASSGRAQIIVLVAIKGQRPPMDPATPESVRRLVSKCWAQDPRSRPSCAEFMRMADIFMRQCQRQERSRSRLGPAQAP